LSKLTGACGTWGCNVRKKFVLFVLIPFVIAALVVYFFIDGWIESGLEYAGEKAVGAKVEIDNLHVSINPIGMEFARLQVADPSDTWKNLFETGKVKFALNFGQLLRGKFIIETMEVNNLILGTKRTTDGFIPKPREEEKKPEPASSSPSFVEQAASKLMPSASKPTVSFDIDRIKRELKIDSLLDPNNLASYRQLDTLKRQIDAAAVQWQATLAEIDKSKTKLADIETRAKAININNIKNLQDANNALTNIKTILNNANEVKTAFNQQKTVLTESVDRFSGSIKGFDDLVAQDYRNVLSMARLPDVSMKGLGALLLGKDVLAKAYTYLGYIEMAKSKIRNSPDKPAEEEQPQRMKGQTINFPAEHSYPKFWIKKILISGGTDKAQDPQYFYVKGQVLNITNDQRITGLPLTADIMATKGGGTTLTLGARFDRRKEPGVDTYKASLTGLPVHEMTIGQSDFLPSKVTNAVASAAISVEVPGSYFESNTKITFANLNFVFKRDPNGTVERIVHDVLTSIKNFSVDLRMWRNQEKFDVAFSTDLDDQLAARTKQVIGNEVAKLQADLRKKLDAKIAEKRQEVEKLLAEKKTVVTDRLKSYEKIVNDKLGVVDAKKKEIDSRIEQEKKRQTESLEKKAKDALKGIFK
jgi:uncharacterized protein (TIGR03545 family)